MLFKLACYVSLLGFSIFALELDYQDLEADNPELKQALALALPKLALQPVSGLWEAKIRAANRESFDQDGYHYNVTFDTFVTDSTVYYRNDSRGEIRIGIEPYQVECQAIFWTNYDATECRVEDDALQCSYADTHAEVDIDDLRQKYEVSLKAIEEDKANKEDN